jgi:hypothetical protein
MTTAECAKFTGAQMEAIAWGFLRSEFTQQIYADWPVDRRIDAYLHHQDLDQIVDDGSAFDLLTERVMANVGRALRSGLLGSPKDRS